MRLVFAHDHKFIEGADGLIYSTGSFPSSMWARYLESFDHITVVARREKGLVQDTDNLTLSVHDKVGFVFLDDFLSPFKFKEKKEAKKKITSLLAKADALVARLPSEIGLVASAIARDQKMKYAVEVVGCGYDALWTHGSIKGKLYAYLFSQKIKNSVKKASAAIYVTQDFLQKRYPNSQLNAFASNVELPPFDLETQETLRQERLSVWKEETITIGLIGHLYADYKGIDVAIETLSKIKQNIDYKIRLQIVGKGAIDKWKKLSIDLGIDKEVAFLGALSGGAAIASWLDTVDLYIQPSKTEGLPRALIEAMSRGCLCAASNVGGIPELLEENYLHRPEDSEKLGQILTGFINNTSEANLRECTKNLNVAQRYSRNTLQTARLDFWSKFADKLK